MSLLLGPGSPLMEVTVPPQPPPPPHQKNHDIIINNYKGISTILTVVVFHINVIHTFLLLDHGLFDIAQGVLERY